MRPALIALGLAIAVTPAGVPELPEPLRAHPGGNDAVADSLVDRWIRASGGMEVYRGMQSATFTLTTELYDLASGRLRYARPRYVTIAKLPSGEASRIERWEGSDFIQQGFDGKRAWAYMNGEPLADTAKDAREALYVARDVFYWFGLPFKLRDPGVYLRYRGRDAWGRHTVAVQFEEGVGEHRDTWIYSFASGNPWPVEVDYIEEGRTSVNRTRWEDIQRADGYPYVGRRVHFDEQGRVSKVIRTSDVRINAGVEPRVFSEP